MAVDDEEEDLFSLAPDAENREPENDEEDDAEEAEGLTLPDLPGGIKREIPPPPDRGPFGKLMNVNFLQYASYTICDRAIPTVEDGLKPVQRRIMHVLWEKDNGKTSKVAGVVGNTMHYHPHGDASIQDAIVVLQQKRYLIKGQGNFGNIFTGAPAAAGRYIECGLTELARTQVFSPKITDYVPSYDGCNQEPVLLQSKIPLLLMLGAKGIAVGLSADIMPHNFIELLEAEIAILQKKPFEVFPDFQTGGEMDVSQYDEGRGFVKVRAPIEIRKNEKNKLFITGVPWTKNTENLVESIERVLKSKKIPIKRIDNFTSENVEIELTLMPGSDPEKVKKSLYAFTDCECKISSNIVVLKENRPCEMTIPEVLNFNVERLLLIFRKEFELRQHEIEATLLQRTLERIFIEERIYKCIESVKEADKLYKAVRTGFIPFKDAIEHEITDEEISQLLKIPIRRISLYDINRFHDEMDALRKEYAELTDNLANLKRYAVKYLKNLIKEYGNDYPRLTQITTFNVIDERALTSTEYSIRKSDDNFFGFDIKTGDVLFPCSSLDKLYLLWKDGRYRFMAPPDRTFIDSNFQQAGIYNRDEVFTCIYTEPLYGFTYIKRFTWGGMILNKEYNLIPEKCKIILFAAGSPKEIYVKYKEMKNQRIKQQIFNAEDIRLSGAGSKGVQMTPKIIAKISLERPRGWVDDAADAVRGTFFD